MTPKQLADRLAGLDADAAARAALAEGARRLAEAVRDALSTPRDGPHDAPWLERGTLRDSVGHRAEGDLASVGSDSVVAVAQELGTGRVPPRPFLQPAAAAEGGNIARAVAAAVAARLEPHA